MIFRFGVRATQTNNTPPTTDEMRPDPKYQPGAYIHLNRRLYMVLSLEPPKGMASSPKLWVENAGDPELNVWLSDREVKASILVRPAPTIEIPDYYSQAA